MQLFDILNLMNFVSLHDDASFHSRLTRPSSEATTFYFGDSIGMATCLDVQQGIDDNLYNPEECGQIGVITKTTSDRCMCRDEITGGTCEALPLTSTLPCDVCEQAGSNMSIGDLKKEINTDGNIWGNIGMLCEELSSLQGMFDFSPSQCGFAQEAAMDSCQCVGPDDQVNTCLPQEDSEFRCDPTSSETNCCLGSCIFRSSEGEYVCSTKSSESPPTNYVEWWEQPTNSDSVSDQAPDSDSISDQAPDSVSIFDQTPGPSATPDGLYIYTTIPTACKAPGQQCEDATDCCGSMQCEQGSQSLVCTGSGDKRVKVSAGGDSQGGSGGKAMRRKLRKVGRSPGKFLRQQE